MQYHGIHDVMFQFQVVGRCGIIKPEFLVEYVVKVMTTGL